MGSNFVSSEVYHLQTEVDNIRRWQDRAQNVLDRNWPIHFADMLSTCKFDDLVPVEFF
jgi:hypothetical protein